MVIVKYNDESEVQTIIDTQTSKGLVLVEIANISEGNFLGFDDRFVEPKTPLDLQSLKDDNLILMDVLATMYEDMLAKGTV